jgi:hypothetical protein
MKYVMSMCGFYALLIFIIILIPIIVVFFLAATALRFLNSKK